jgi:hypothetical protein
LLEDHTIFGGVTDTDVHVALPGLLIICAALVVGAFIAASNVFTACFVRISISRTGPERTGTFHAKPE